MPYNRLVYSLVPPAMCAPNDSPNELISESSPYTPICKLIDVLTSEIDHIYVVLHGVRIFAPPGLCVS